jgi:hypothetical protein
MADWQLRRLRKVEAQLWARALREQPSAIGAWDSEQPVFKSLHRRIDAAERSYYRALKELQRSAAARAESEEASEPAQASLPQPPAFFANAAPVPPAAWELASISSVPPRVEHRPLRDENPALRL